MEKFALYADARARVAHTVAQEYSKLYTRLIYTFVSPKDTNAASITSNLTAWFISYWSLSFASSCSEQKSLTSFLFVESTW